MAENCYCTDVQLRLALNTAEIDSCLSDERGDTTPASIASRALEARETGAWMIWGIIRTRPDIAAIAALKPSAYTAGDGTYPVLERMNSQLSADLVRRRNPARENEPVPFDHPVFEMARAIARSDMDIS